MLSQAYLESKYGRLTYTGYVQLLPQLVLQSEALK